MDQLLDSARTGCFYLRQPEIANATIDTIRHSAEELKRFQLHAFVIMPNHAHMLVTPRVPLPELTRTVKSYSAKQANQILGLTGQPFWQEESYDHLVRNQREFERIKLYVENNPVRAGLVCQPEDYPWSSGYARNHE
jgi:putative DNA methylase